MAYTHPYSLDGVLYCYQWKIPLGPSTVLTQLAEECMSSTHTDHMEPADLHCTSYVSVGPDFEYENSWYRELNDKLTITHVFWLHRRCAAPSQEKLFQCMTVLLTSLSLSLSLSKRDSEWKDLGPLVQKCLSAQDWQPVEEEGVFYSP